MSVSRQGPIRKAVFPVAGLGTRFLPATKAIPKEMLPIVDRPLIQYAVEEALEAGIDTLIFVTNRNKHAIADHFDCAYEIQSRLQADGKQGLLARIDSIIPQHVSCIFVTQPEALGLGHAVLCAASAVGEEPFAVLLPDDLVINSGPGALSQMVSLHGGTGASVIGVETIPLELTSRYGIVDIKVDDDGNRRIHSMVEKPAPQDAPSNLGVVGRYILHHRVFHHLGKTAAGAGGEIQLTDAIAAMLDESPVLACAFEGARYDCGSRTGFLKATIDSAMQDPDLREKLIPHLRDVLDRLEH